MDFRALNSKFGERPLAKIGEKTINLTSKLGKINDIEHKNGSEICPQNQVILDCFYVKQNSDMGHCFS